MAQHILLNLVLLFAFLAPIHGAQITVTVGTGSSGSCTETALNTEFNKIRDNEDGGTLEFNCGSGEVEIPITSTLWAKRVAMTVDGGGKITLNAQSSTRHFIVANDGDLRYGLHGVTDLAGGDTLHFTLKNIKLINGFGDTVRDPANSQAVGHENNKFHGGCIYVGEKGKLTVEGVTFENCRSYQSYGENNGGAIYIKQKSEGVYITGCTFKNNWSKNQGGAIYSSDFVEHFHVDNCQFTNNEAHDDGESGGGAIAVKGNEDFRVTNSVFRNNRAHHGGAIKEVLSDFEISDSQFYDNIADIALKAPNYNSAVPTALGGAIYCDGAALNKAGRADFHRLKFVNNIAANKGGAVYLCLLLERWSRRREDDGQ